MNYRARVFGECQRVVFPIKRVPLVPVYRCWVGCIPLVVVEKIVGLIDGLNRVEDIRPQLCLQKISQQIAITRAAVGIAPVLVVRDDARIWVRQPGDSNAVGGKGFEMEGQNHCREYGESQSRSRVTLTAQGVSVLVEAWIVGVGSDTDAVDKLVCGRSLNVNQLSAGRRNRFCLGKYVEAGRRRVR